MKNLKKTAGVLATVATISFAFGCSETKEETGSEVEQELSAEKPEATKEPEAAAQEPEEWTEENLPLPEDYADQETAEVTEENYEAALATLEKEILNDKE